MAAWIALQLLRGPATRTSMSELVTGAMQMELIVGGRAALRERRVEAGEPHDDVAIDEAWIDLFRNPYELRVTANHHLLYVADMLPSVIASLMDRWWLLTTFERRGLTTSDHPVFVVPNAEAVQLGLGTGIENADILYVPLTRRHALSMALRATLPPDLARVSADRMQRGVTQTALYSNHCSVMGARRWLFHHPADAPLEGILLHPPKSSEVQQRGDPWAFMSAEDRRVLADAGVTPPNIGNWKPGSRGLISRDRAPTRP